MSHRLGFRPLGLALLTLLALAPAVSAPAVQAQTSDPAGAWSGQIEIPGNPLGVTVELARDDAGAWAGTIDIPQQGAVDLPLGGIHVAGDSVVFTIEGVPGDPTFRGLISSDGATMSGDFQQGPGLFPFTLTRAEGADLGDALVGLEEWLAEHMEAWKVPGLGLAVVSGGEVVLAEGYGLRNVEDSLPADGETLFAIGSSSKAFTTALLGTLVDDGELDWDAPVRRYLPELALADTAEAAALTVRDLVTHRSGLPRHDVIWYANPDLTRAEIVERLAHLPPTQPLRGAWQYNNLMFITAGYLAERLGGDSWEDLTRARLFEPLGMARSNFAVSVSQADPNHAVPYSEHERELVRVPFRTIDAVGPAGSINSSAAEMARWVQLHLAGGTLDGRTVLERGTVEAMQTPAMAIAARPSDPALGVQTYGLGWFVDGYRGHFRVQHGGNIDGFSAMVVLYPHDGLGIVVLTNKNGTPMPEFTARQVADRVFGLELRDWSGEALARRDVARARADSLEAAGEGEDEAGDRIEGTSPSHAFAAYAATYRHAGYGDLEIRANPDGAEYPLHLAYYTMELELEHVHYDVFVTRDPAGMSPFAGQRVRFVTGFDGSVEAVELAIEPSVSAARFPRAPEDRLTDPAFLGRLTGSYRLDGQTISVTRRGTSLVVSIPGQPAYTLVADRDTSFTLEQAPQIRVSFDLPTDGASADASAVTFHQPNGTFRYERVEGA
jgi:CubicO group peptidase (beta-lactamase class C family)